MDGAATHAEVLAIEIPVRWGDMDAFRHVNNTLYFRYFEQIRCEWLDDIFPGWDAADEGPILATSSCNFRIPINYPATVRVSMYCAEPGNSSIKTFYRITDADDPSVLYAEGDCVVVWIDQKTGKSKRVPDFIREHIAKS